MGDFQPFVLSAEMLGHEGPVSRCRREFRRDVAQWRRATPSFLFLDFHLLLCSLPCSLDVFCRGLPASGRPSTVSGSAWRCAHWVFSVIVVLSKSLGGCRIVSCVCKPVGTIESWGRRRARSPSRAVVHTSLLRRVERTKAATTADRCTDRPASISEANGGKARHCALFPLVGARTCRRLLRLGGKFL